MPGKTDTTDKTETGKIRTGSTGQQTLRPVNKDLRQDLKRWNKEKKQKTKKRKIEI